MRDRTIAALYVEVGGVYYGDSRFDPWGVSRDARRYKGPYRVIAHPPCKRWGRYWSGGPSAKASYLKGDDDGCFAAALWAVRTFGGVLEHPEASHAWVWFGLERPQKSGGWTGLDAFGGRSCCVEQGHYGHKARKATWLYAVDCQERPLTWGPSSGVRFDEGFHTAAERAAARYSGVKPVKRLTAAERLATPERFRDMLADIVGQPQGSLRTSKSGGIDEG